MGTLGTNAVTKKNGALLKRAGVPLKGMKTSHKMIIYFRLNVNDIGSVALE